MPLPWKPDDFGISFDVVWDLYVDMAECCTGVLPTLNGASDTNFLVGCYLNCENKLLVGITVHSKRLCSMRVQCKTRKYRGLNSALRSRGDR